MTFEIEVIDQTRADELFKWIGDTFIFQMQSTIVIDRERDIIFVSLGGQGNMPPDRGECADFFCLLWERKPIYFNGYWKGETTSDGYRKVLEIEGIRIPRCLESLFEEIKSTIDITLSKYYSHFFLEPMSARAQFPDAPSYFDREVK